MRYLGIDYGTKRVGIALSDEEGNFAFPNKVIEVKNEPQVIAELISIVAQEKVTAIVIGLPLNFHFQETPQTRVVKEFGERFRKDLEGMPILFVNEVLSTKEAERSPGVSKKMIDAASAAVLLQSFLDAHRQK